MSKIINYHFTHSDVSISTTRFLGNRDSDIIIDMTGMSIGGHSLVGYLAKHHIDALNSDESHRVILQNIMNADSSSICSPGIMMMFGYELNDLPDNWEIIVADAQV